MTVLLSWVDLKALHGLCSVLGVNIIDFNLRNTWVFVRQAQATDFDFDKSTPFFCQRQSAFW